MKRFPLLFLVLLFTAALAACTAKEEAPKPLSEPGEKLYTVRGVILSRDAAANTLHLDHERIPGFMEPMKMDYGVRGTKVEALPQDGTRIEAKLHVTERSYWLTEVQAIP